MKREATATIYFIIYVVRTTGTKLAPAEISSSGNLIEIGFVM